MKAEVRDLELKKVGDHHARAQIEPWWCSSSSPFALDE